MLDGVGDRLLYAAKQGMGPEGVKRIEIVGQRQMNLRSRYSPRKNFYGSFQIGFPLFAQLTDNFAYLGEQKPGRGVSFFYGFCRRTEVEA